MVFGAAGAAQTPKNDELRPAQKPCIKNPRVSSGAQSRAPDPAPAVAADVNHPCPKPRARPWVRGRGRGHKSELSEKGPPGWADQKGP